VRLTQRPRSPVLFRLDHVAPGFVADPLGSLQAGYPRVPVVFCDNRQVAEEWTFRFLGAALARARQASKTNPVHDRTCPKILDPGH